MMSDDDVQQLRNNLAEHRRYLDQVERRLEFYDRILDIVETTIMLVIGTGAVVAWTSGRQDLAIWFTFVLAMYYWLLIDDA